MLTFKLQAQTARSTRRRLSCQALALLSLSLLNACGPAPTTNPAPSPSASSVTGAFSDTSPRPSGMLHPEASALPTAEPTAAPMAEPTAAPSSSPSAAASSAPEDMPTPSASTAPSASPTAVPAEQARSGLLTAGTWRDLDHWDFWLGLMGKAEWSRMTEYWGISPLRRLSIQVQHEDRPAIDQALVLKDNSGAIIAKGRSDNQGQADFFTGLFNAQSGPYRIETADGSAVLEGLQPAAFTASANSNHQTEALKVHQLSLATAPGSPQAVDLMLMVDTTGSMGDELEYLKIELRSVLSRVQQANAQLQLRASANFYRDTEDAYVVRPFPFTSDFEAIQTQLQAQSAEGGGDTPEAVTEALDNALNQHDWSIRARARLLFLVLDAPPHHAQRQLAHLKALIPKAQELGVKVIPVASSGIDKETEFLMRMLAITSGGEYVFLTDDSGIGTASGHIEPTIGEHKVEKLNDLMVKLVQKYSD